MLQNPVLRTVWKALASLKLAIVLLAVMMLLVVACTLAQVDLGTYEAVHTYITSVFIWWPIPGTDRWVPVFPGGALVGLLLAVNLTVAQVDRIKLSWSKSGLWIAHAGLILLVLGMFGSGLMQVESRMAIGVGETVDYVESAGDYELAVTDTSDPKTDEVWGVPESLLRGGGTLTLPGSPLVLTAQRYLRNSEPGGQPGPDADAQGLGADGRPFAARELPGVTRDDELNRPAAQVEIASGGRSLGTWLVVEGLPRPAFSVEGRRFVLGMRLKREYLGYAVTLKKFSHDVYAGTDIPRNFSSLVHLSNAGRGEERDVLIYMNQPLRYAGKAFYQASFGRGDTLSVLQVVENPGWLVPYLSCLLVAVGLCIHFGLSLRRATRKAAAAAAEA